MSRWAYVCLCIIALGAAGCGEKGPVAPPLAKVAGTVTLDGKPMEGGEVRFNTVGQAPRVIAVQGGAFTGEVYVGPNQIDVVWDKEGPPHPMDPNIRIPVNAISSQFQGPNSPLKAEVGETGATDLKFEVTSAR
jgi:predicted small lipoprotein YifL